VIEGGPHPKISQEESGGDEISEIAPNPGTEYAAVHFEMSPEQRRAVVEFARWAVGCGYGFASIAADLFNCLTAQELSLGWGSRMVCSTQACRAAERCSFIPDREPECVMPAHLAWYAGIGAELGNERPPAAEPPAV